MLSTMQQRYNIGELSREFGVTTRALRFYEDEGLLSPTRDGTRRIFSTRDHTRVKLILRGKRLGFTLREIRELLDLYDGPEGESSQLELFIRKLSEHRTALIKQRSEIDAVLTEMKVLATQCEHLLRRANKTY